MNPHASSASLNYKGHLMMVDGNNLVRTVFEAIKIDDTEVKAKKTIENSWKSIYRGIKEHAPTHFLMVFDGAGPTWRHEVYADYKKDRKPMDENLRWEIDEFKIALNHCGLYNTTASKFEAEDVMASVGVKAVERMYKVTALSSDKDFCYLVSLGINLVNHFNSEARDSIWIKNRYGVEPSQMVDFLALFGDSVDGIPGVDKVGEKTAAKLLLEFGNLESVLQAAKEQKIKGVVGSNLVSQSDRALLSKRLATLSLDAPLSVSPAELRLQHVDFIRGAQAQWMLDSELGNKKATPRLGVA